MLYWKSKQRGKFHISISTKKKENHLYFKSHTTIILLIIIFAIYWWYCHNTNVEEGLGYMWGLHLALSAGLPLYIFIYIYDACSLKCKVRFISVFCFDHLIYFFNFRFCWYMDLCCVCCVWACCAFVGVDEIWCVLFVAKTKGGYQQSKKGTRVMIIIIYIFFQFIFVLCVYL